MKSIQSCPSFQTFASSNIMSVDESMESSKSNKTMEELMCASLATMSVSEARTLSSTHENSAFDSNKSNEKNSLDAFPLSLKQCSSDALALGMSVDVSHMTANVSQLSTELKSRNSLRSGLSLLGSSDNGNGSWASKACAADSPTVLAPREQVNVDPSHHYTVFLAIGDEEPKEVSISNLLEAIKNKQTFRYLHFSSDHFHDGGVVPIMFVLSKASKRNTLFQHFQFDSTRMSHGTLIKYGIGDRVATALAGALERNVVVQHVGLQDNLIGDDGATAMAKALKSNTSLVHLELTSNLISDEGATKLAKALETNTTLRKLDLGSNSIGDDGATALAKALETNTTLQQLCLFENLIGGVGATALLEALQNHNETLLCVELHSNNISNDLVSQVFSLVEQNRRGTRALRNDKLIIFSLSEDTRTYVEGTEITADDVVGGSHSTGSSHPGNVAYRNDIEANKPLHKTLGRQHGEKTKIRNMIVDNVIKRGGRFIKEEGGRFYLLTKEEAQRKVTEALKPRKSRAKATHVNGRSSPPHNGITDHQKPFER